MWPFKASGKRGQTPAQVRAEVIELRNLLIESEEARDWFKARWEEAGERALQADEAELVAKHAMDRIAELEVIVAALEEIAGPYVPAVATEEPIYEALRSCEITQEIPVQPSTAVALVVKPLADAELVDAR